MIDLHAVSSARVQTCLLGGVESYEEDRALAQALVDAAPWYEQVVRHERASMPSAVRHMLAGPRIRQVLDLGCGLYPPGLSAYEVAWEAGVRDARVVFVDRDPQIVAHARTDEVFAYDAEGRVDA